MSEEYEIFESDYETNFTGNGVWKVLDGIPDNQGAKRHYDLIRLERRMVDYFYQKLYEKKDSHRHWVTVVKYGSKTLYLACKLEEFSNWFYSDTILCEGGHAWHYKNRVTEHKKYRLKPKD